MDAAIRRIATCSSTAVLLLLLFAGMASAEIIYNNSISGAEYGIYNNNSDSRLVNNTITGCGHGIYNYLSNNTIENNTIYGNNKSGIVNRDNSSVNITSGNNVTDNSLYGVVNIDSRPEIGQAIGNNSQGQMLWAWYVRIEALNTTGGAVSGASINFTDNQSALGAFEYWEYWVLVSPYPMTTDGSGWTGWFIAYQNRTENDSGVGVTNLTNHTVFGRKAGVGKGWNSIFMNESKEGNVTLNESVTLNVTILINGDPTTVFQNSGEPYNVTVIVNDSNTYLPIYNATVRIVESNGDSPFVLPQYQVSNVSCWASGVSSTNPGGNVSLTIVPTGGRGIVGDVVTKIGPYQPMVEVYYGDYDTFTTNLSVTDSSLPEPGGLAPQVPNRPNVDYYNSEVYRVFDKVIKWLALGGGEMHNITVYDNGTAIDTMGFTVVSGKPTGLNVTVLNSTYPNDPIAGAVVRANETNGYPPYALPQYGSDSNVSNSVYGDVRTGADGNALMAVIPTGGRGIAGGVVGMVGEYNITVEVFAANGTRIYNGTMACDRTLPEPSGTAVSIPNRDNVDYYNSEVYRVFDRIKKWLG